MRHLIDAYIKADEARKISDFGELGLVDLIVKSGIAAAIASLPDGIRANRDAVAEVITNNVRSRIMREHLHDPAFYNRMSVLLAEVLADLKARRIDYEEFLKRMAALAAQVRAGQAEDTPEPLKQNPGLRAVYNTLAAAPSPSGAVAEPKTSFGEVHGDPVLERAQQIDARIRGSAPDGWRGVLPKEQEVKRLIYEVVQDTALVELLFPVVKARPEY
jgi:type I restriction enzyme R subunit